MAWTKQQEKAIYERGQNIIVSAGAGSGKTAVLSERILDYCLKGNDIRQGLVLTFTNAEALEMKERIITAYNIANPHKKITETITKTDAKVLKK